MIKMDISRMCVSMTETMLPRFSNSKIGLQFVFDLREDYYEKAKSAATFLKIIIQRPSNYTKVLINYKYNNFRKDIKMGNKPLYFEKHSDHDSCWRSDGFRIFSIHFDNIEKYFGIHPTDQRISKFNTVSMFHHTGLVLLKQFEPVKEDNYVKGYNILTENLSFAGLVINNNGGYSLKED